MKKGRNKGGSGSRGGRKGSGRQKKFVPVYEGRVQMTREGFIFVIVDGQDDDIFVKASKTRNALDGDIVKVAVTKMGDAKAAARAGEKATRKREGEVVEIVKRSGKQFVGIFHTVGAQAWVLMQSKNMPYDIEVDAEEAAKLGAKRGMKVSVVVDRWNRGDYSPIGHIVDVLGEPGENNAEMHAILAEFNLPYKFEKEVEDAADGISEEITAADLKGRKDFRDTFTFTIDPADAKDFDDALSFRKLGNGNYEVGVHIADVSWYVKPGSAVDKEARERGTSVYLVDRTVPMLPEKLCNKLCSLRPHEDKLTYSVVCEISPKAEIKSRWIGRTVINSDFRLDYDQAQAIIEAGSAGVVPSPTASTATADDAPPSGTGPLPLSRGWRRSCEGTTPADQTLTEAITTLHGLAAKLKEKRFKAGAVDFDRPEMKVEVDEKGRPINVYQKVSKEANWLIEEFMLLANRTVAEFVATDGQMNGVASKKAKTFVYRIHDLPNAEKLEGLKRFAKGFGYKMGDSLDGRAAAKSINALMKQAAGKPELEAFEDIALRSMAKACYSPDNIGHYGLAFDFYTHFTSPIRRYPDLMVHRLLTLYLAGKESQNKGYYEIECQHASDREVVAADAERTSIKYKLVEYMQDKVGQEFDGRVSGVTEWGMYVEIEPSKVEGMVSLREIRSDFFEFDEERYRLVGKRTHKIYRLGDKVRIRVKNANLEQRLLDYELIENLK
ncbi:MAG: RNB domain-containing ribonuclease [Bacteroidales bacterium]|nr:RNB domain-containing ribonuclease [Bacteroidales bacterium]